MPKIRLAFLGVDTYVHMVRYCRFRYLRLVLHSQSHHLQLQQLCCGDECVFHRHHSSHYMRSTQTIVPKHSLQVALKWFYVSIFKTNWYQIMYKQFSFFRILLIFILTFIFLTIYSIPRELIKPAMNSFFATSWPCCSYSLVLKVK